MRSTVGLIIVISIEDHVTAMVHAMVCHRQLAILDNFPLRDGSSGSVSLINVVTVRGRTNVWLWSACTCVLHHGQPPRSGASEVVKCILPQRAVVDLHNMPAYVASERTRSASVCRAKGGEEVSVL